MVKRCILEPKNDQWDYLISDHAQSEVQVLSAANLVEVSVHFRKVKGKEKEAETLHLQEFISVKGWKAAGNQLSAWPVKQVLVLREEWTSSNEPEALDMEAVEAPSDESDKPEGASSQQSSEAATYPTAPREEATDLDAETVLEAQPIPAQPEPMAPAENHKTPAVPSITLEVVDLTTDARSPEPSAASTSEVEDGADTEEDGQFTLKF
jgi:hypothetical protein